MIDTEIFREFALSFAETTEQPHFDATSFRVNGKIFASLEIDKLKACLKFSLNDQQQFCTFDKAIYPVDNHWGKSGWTYIDIDKIREDLLVDALTSAYKEVSKSKKKKKK
jgi:predicted DNA-binding protein (MmcQ/YjbR family)